MRIKEVLNKQGYVINQNIQTILKVPRFRAARIAKRLIGLGLVEKQRLHFVTNLWPSSYKKYPKLYIELLPTNSCLLRYFPVSVFSIFLI
jgi:hypothetical protein